MLSSRFGEEGKALLVLRLITNSISYGLKITISCELFTRRDGWDPQDFKTLYSIDNFLAFLP